MKCKECDYCTKLISGYRCMFPYKLPYRYIADLDKVLDCCPKLKENIQKEEEE